MADVEPMFDDAFERLEALKKLGWPGYGPPYHPMRYSAGKVNDVVTEVVKWNRERQKPRPWHYALRLYRRCVLPAKDWRLPWR